MTQEEYRSELRVLQDQFNKQAFELSKKYALANNPYSIGDIIRDHIGSVKIESIQITKLYGSDLPTCIYSGVELKKDGTPRKDGSKRFVYQENIEKL